MEILAIFSILILPAVFQACVNCVMSGTVEIQQNKCRRSDIYPLPSAIKDNCYALNLGKDKCDRVTRDFIKAFDDRDPRYVKESDYNDYFTDLPIEAGINQNLFWSGREAIFIVIEISKNMNTYGVTVSSSANAHSSTIINMLRDYTKSTPCWCGVQGGSIYMLGGIDYTSEYCDSTPTDTFWAEFSARFAQAASGTAFFLCNGQGTPYSKTSYFRKVEIPNMNRDTVKQVVVMVMHEDGKGETCASPKPDSLVALKDDLTKLKKKKKIDYVCVDIIGDPNNIKANAQKVANVIKKFQNGQNINRNMKMWDLLRLVSLLQNQA